MRASKQTQAWPAIALHLWLALCLLLAQGLGQGHRAAHLGLKLAATAVEQGPADAWGHALGSTDCQLFDQLAQADQASTAEFASALLVLGLVPASRPALRTISAVGPSPRARGPPLLA